MKTSNDIALRFRRFKVKYLPATSNRGSRVNISDMMARKSKTIPYDYEFNSALDIAVNYLDSLGISCDTLTLGSREDYILSEDFETPLT
ncbi:MAG: hypothetical protein V3V47_01835 [Desulfobacteria bacterium]